MKNRHFFSGKSNGAFSLVEVVMALGIVSLSCLTVIGLVPTGLSSLQTSVNTTTSNEIVSRLSAEIQQADFSALSTNTAAVITKYYDDQGNELPSSTGAVYSAQAFVKNASASGVSTTLPGNTTSNLAVIQITIQNPKATVNAKKTYSVYVANQ